MNLSRSKILLVLCLSFIVGVFLGRFLNLEIMAILAMIFVVIATVGWQNKIARLVGLAGLILILGGLRMHVYAGHNDLEKFYGQNAKITGVVVEEPDVRLDKTYLTLGHVSIG